jgi:hypothetical protein
MKTDTAVIELAIAITHSVIKPPSVFLKLVDEFNDCLLPFRVFD